MYIVLHCGGMPFNGDTIKSKSLGGSESAAYYMAKELAAKGHDVTMFTASQERGTFDGVKYEWHGNQTEKAPLGEFFHMYATGTPHDVLIIQRHPLAFANKYASKVNMWWVHDLALARMKPQTIAMMYNVDRVLCVSEWHKKQIKDVWGLDDNVVAIQNGVDLELFQGDICKGVTRPEHAKTRLLYTSRPERGLVNLLRPGGIMDKLQDRPDIHLYVCGYENTTEQMRPFYEQLWARCDTAPNVTRMGALTKHELADVMRQCDALVYPTQFEEVSCITAMEAMAAGLPMITTPVGALPETCHDSGTKFIPLLDNGDVDVDKFVRAIRQLGSNDHTLREKMRAKQHAAAQRYTWKFAANMVLDAVDEVLLQRNPLSLAHHFMRHSDMVAYQLSAQHKEDSAFAAALEEEWERGYGFYRDDTYAQHYADYYAYEKARGVNYGPEDVTGTTRFRVVANAVGKLPEGSRVLDYGCAHGHYTVALAKLFPRLHFVGMDLEQTNVDKATGWAAMEGLGNVRFLQGDALRLTSAQNDHLYSFNAIIAAEVIEHVGQPQEYLDTLELLLAQEGQMIITVPYGPWEAQGYREHGYWRAHLHHFERADLKEMLGHKPNYNVFCVPSGPSMFGSMLGSYVVTYNKSDERARNINMDRKIAQTVPDQTVSLCMIVKDVADDIGRALHSVLPFVQEVVIGVDNTTKDSTYEVLARLRDQNPLVGFKVFDIEPALETGFAAARNATIKRASCDWILWMDADEVLVNGEQLAQYLRNNMFGGYGIEQHHWSTDPVGVIKVDIPCRLFRNGRGVQFFGYVHEHPEQRLNDGLGPVLILNGPKIMHYGYKDERVRRARFARNIGLLMRDRKEYPERLLGKFLYLRDLAQMCQYDILDGRADVGVFQQRAHEGIRLWEELLESGNLRLVVDGLQFYSQLVDVLGGGMEFGFKVDAAMMGHINLDRVQPITGLFLNMKHISKLLELTVRSKTADFNTRYF